ncbi:MAG: hypothetical protein ACRDKX_07115 [Solirubrobacterales bacterium]
MTESELIDPTYMPFSVADLRERFNFTPRRSGSDPATRFVASARRYSEHLAAVAAGAAPSPREVRRASQIQKDETFWTAACLMAFFHAGDPQGSDRGRAFAGLLERAFGPTPPLPDLDSWPACVAGGVELFFEVGLSSPQAYRDWLRKHLDERVLIPYLRDAAKQRSRLEGRTHLDAMLIAPKTGFAAHFEAKVSSDTDCQVTFDCMRNQIARNIDAMLEPPGRRARPPLNERRPDRSVFVLLTPEVFKREPATSRLYGWLMSDYMARPDSLARDLPHRPDEDWSAVSRRLGWLTWEDCNTVLPGACRWLAG